MTEEKKEEIRISPEELKKLKHLYTNIRLAQQNAQAIVQEAGQAYEKYAGSLAISYGVDEEEHQIDRLTGVITIMPGKIPGIGGGPQQQPRMR